MNEAAKRITDFKGKTFKLTKDAQAYTNDASHKEASLKKGTTVTVKKVSMKYFDDVLVTSGGKEFYMSPSSLINDAEIQEAAQMNMRNIINTTKSILNEANKPFMD